MLDNKEKVIVTKESLINTISNQSKDDFISMEDLFKIIDKLSYEDEIISKRTLIKSIKNHHTKTVVRDVYNMLEDEIFNSLSSVNGNKDICIKLFEGISLDGTFVSGKTKKNNLTGQVSLVHSKIKPKFNITRSYCEKLNGK